MKLESQKMKKEGYKATEAGIFVYSPIKIKSTLPQELWLENEIKMILELQIELKANKPVLGNLSSSEYNYFETTDNEDRPIYITIHWDAVNDEWRIGRIMKDFYMSGKIIKK